VVVVVGGYWWWVGGRRVRWSNNGPTMKSHSKSSTNDETPWNLKMWPVLFVGGREGVVFNINLPGGWGG